jgi:katanin p60 ATPase-containing subunit A1
VEVRVNDDDDDDEDDNHDDDDDSVNVSNIAKMTEGYSGADIMLLSKEIAMRPVRKLMKKLMERTEYTEKEVVENNALLLSGEIDSDVSIDKVNKNDVELALSCTKPSSNGNFLEKYKKWEAEFGASLLMDDEQEKS